MCTVLQECGIFNHVSGSGGLEVISEKEKEEEDGRARSRREKGEGESLFALIFSWWNYRNFFFILLMEEIPAPVIQNPSNSVRFSISTRSWNKFWLPWKRTTSPSGKKIKVHRKLHLSLPRIGILEVPRPNLALARFHSKTAGEKTVAKNIQPRRHHPKTAGEISWMAKNLALAGSHPKSASKKTANENSWL